jgi:hypothetical protein
VGPEVCLTGAMKTRPPSLIDGWLGREARLLERHESPVAAPPERVAEAVERVRLTDMPIVRLLFLLRRIPHSKEMTLREFFTTPPFLILEEVSEQEVVFGVEGRPWRLRERPSTPDPERFRASGQPGTVRTIANLRVDATENGSRLSTETWVETFGHRARWLFRAYWLIVGPFSALIRRQFLRAARKMAEG